MKRSEKKIKIELKNLIQNSCITIIRFMKELCYLRSYVNIFLNIERSGSIIF
jgi:hypothetical protein